MMNKRFTQNELMFLITIGLALGIRQMAMTMIMPFIATYSETLSYSTTTLAGIALGIFGLTQAIFQIPFGIWSDKVGNKLVMLIGILEVIIGLFIAYFAKNIYVLIFSRALQGSGAIIAVGYSWACGSVDNKKRPRALSILGVIIGVSAAASFALGSLVHNYLTVRQMFLVCAIMISIVWIIILVFLKEEKAVCSNETELQEVNIRESIRVLLKNRLFIRLNLAGFINNFTMTAVFFMIPLYLDKITGINGMWKIFMPAVIIAIICMRKAIKYVERGYSLEAIMVFFLITAAGICCYFNEKSFCFILLGSILFMTGYISLSTIIPSVANDIAEDGYRGTANGIINSFQYIGSFFGAVVAGALWNGQGKITLWLLIALSIIGVFTVIKVHINKTQGEEL